MRISRAPFRVSLFGGGTDFKSWYSLHGATIIAFSIDRYCYVSLRSLLPFYGNKYRIAWSSIETPMSIDEIQHPSIRKCLLFKGLTDGLEIHTDGDLPARSGLGSSSSFTVAFLHACNAFSSTNASVNALAREAIYVEQEILSESVGIQDQIQACYGGFNVMKINQDGKFSIFSLSIDNSLVSEIQESLVLVYSGIQRTSSEIQKQIKCQNNENHGAYLDRLKNIHDIASEVSARFLDDTLSYTDFCSYLSSSWASKSTLLPKSRDTLTLLQIYDQAIAAGASCGKVLGAGGGGFLAFFVDPTMKAHFISMMKPYICIEPRISSVGVHSVL